MIMGTKKSVSTVVDGPEESHFHFLNKRHYKLVLTNDSYNTLTS